VHPKHGYNISPDEQSGALEADRRGGCRQLPALKRPGQRIISCTNWTPNDPMHGAVWHRPLWTLNSTADAVTHLTRAPPISCQMTRQNLLVVLRSHVSVANGGEKSAENPQFHQRNSARIPFEYRIDLALIPSSTPNQGRRESSSGEFHEIRTVNPQRVQLSRSCRTGTVKMPSVLRQDQD